MKKLQDVDDLVDLIAKPTVYLTKNNKHKSVRAAGQIAVVIPLLPYTVLIFVLAAVLTVIGFLLLEIVDWWERV